MSQIASLPAPAPQSVTAPLLRRPLVLLVRRAWRQDRMKVGAALVCLLVGVTALHQSYIRRTTTAPYAGRASAS